MGQIKNVSSRPHTFFIKRTPESILIALPALRRFLVVHRLPLVLSFLLVPGLFFSTFWVVWTASIDSGIETTGYSMNMPCSNILTSTGRLGSKEPVRPGEFSGQAPPFQLMYVLFKRPLLTIPGTDVCCNTSEARCSIGSTMSGVERTPKLRLRA